MTGATASEVTAYLNDQMRTAGFNTEIVTQNQTHVIVNVTFPMDLGEFSLDVQSVDKTSRFVHFRNRTKSVCRHIHIIYAYMNIQQFYQQVSEHVNIL